MSEFDESHRDFRHAMNESVHRTMNEQRRRGNSPAATSMRCECECHRAGCGDSFVIAMDAYEAVRANGRRFVVTPGHQHESETIISTTEDYFVIEKAGEQGRISDSLKPR